MKNNQLIEHAVKLVNILAIFSDEEKDKLIAVLPRLSAVELEQTLKVLQQARMRQDKMVAELPPGKAGVLGRDLDAVLRNALVKAEQEETEREEVLLKSMEGEIEKA